MGTFAFRARLASFALFGLMAFGVAVGQMPAPSATSADPAAVPAPAPPSSTSPSYPSPSPAVSPQAYSASSGSGAQAPGLRAADGTPAVASSVRIGPGDLVEVSVFGATDLSGRFRVSDSGDIDLPVAGRIHLNNLDAESAARQIEQRLKSADIMN